MGPRLATETGLRSVLGTMATMKGLPMALTTVPSLDQTWQAIPLAPVMGVALMGLMSAVQREV